MKEYICIDGFVIIPVVFHLRFDNLHMLLLSPRIYVTKITKILLFSIELY